MQPRRIVGIILLTVCVVLLVVGIFATNSFGSQVPKFFTRWPTDRAIWLTIGGIVAIIAGALTAKMPFRATSR